MNEVKELLENLPVGGVPFYEEKGRTQPRSIRGTFRSLKTWTAILLLGWWHLAPFLRWDRGPGAPDQAILIDMGGRRAYFFFIEIWPQEVYYLTGLLLIAAISLFLMSALAGRVWCGFLCWQTVYTDIFISIERLFLGDRNRRLALSQAKWNVEKLVRLGLVNLACLIVSILCGTSFVLYSGDAPHELLAIVTGQATTTAYGIITVVGGLCFLLAGHARERVCIYVCPYSRFQAAMSDEHSLVVSYEAWRGEPRGHAKAAAQSEGKYSFAGRGHCVDCNMCVQVCPTNTDIRRGSQLSCIGCGLCVDACNTVMDHFGLPRGLVSYDSCANQLARSTSSSGKFNLVRPRTLIYAAIILGIGTVMLVSLMTRADVRVDVLHDRAPLAVEVGGGWIRNGYDYKILNMARQSRKFTLRLNGIAGAKLDIVGGTKGQEQADLLVGPDTVGSFRVYVTAEITGDDQKSRPLTFVLTDASGTTEIDSRTFFALP